MKITRVEGILLSAPLPPEHVVRWSGGEISVAHAALARVSTDAGLSGLGDTYAGGWFYPRAAKALVEHFEPLLLGEDPRDVARLAHGLWARSQYWGRVGAAVHAISAIENALWDLAGQAHGVPAWRLLGGLAHQRLPLYASGGLERSRDQTVAELRGYVDQGFRAVKVRVSTDLERAVEKVRLCRETLGPAVQLMVDAVMGSHPEPWSAKDAIRFAHAIEPFDVAWLEEPCAAYDVDGYAAVRRATAIPVSGGETSSTVHEYRRFFDAGALDIVQPDACTSGGLLECTRIAALARAYGVRVAPHAWGSAATVMANLHWAFATPGIPVHEYPTWGFPLRDALLVEPLAITDGAVAPPQAPGLGLALPADVRERYPWQGGPAATMRRG